MTHELARICRQLTPLIGKSANALWTHYQLAENAAARAEAEHLIRMMGVAHLGVDVNNDEVRLPPPAASALKGSIGLGASVYPGARSSPIGLKKEEIFRHIGIFATTGAGKSNVAFHLIEQFQKRRIPFMVIDWKRSYRNLRSLPHLENLKVFTVGRPAAPFNWNPLRPPPGVHVQTWIQILSETLEKTHVSGQGVADILAEHADAEFEARGYYEGKSLDGNYPSFFDLRERIERRRFSGRRSLWRDSCLRMLRTFTTGSAVAAFNARSPCKLEELLNDSVVLELDLEMPRAVRAFFSEIVLRWIHLFRLKQGESNSLRHVLILEEAHNIFPRVSSAGALDGLENVYREIRSFGQGLVAITQHPSLLPIYLLGNTHTLIMMALTHEADIISARQALFMDREDDVILDRLKVGQGIVKIKGRVSPTQVQFPLVKVKLGTIRDKDLAA